MLSKLTVYACYADKIYKNKYQKIQTEGRVGVAAVLDPRLLNEFDKVTQLEYYRCGVNEIQSINMCKVS